MSGFNQVNKQLNNITFCRLVATTQVPLKHKQHFDYLGQHDQLAFLENQAAKVKQHWDVLSLDAIKRNFDTVDYALDDNLRRMCDKYWIYMRFNVFTKNLLTSSDIKTVCQYYGVNVQDLKKYYQHVVRYRRFDRDYKYYRLSRGRGIPMNNWFKNKK
ncbi:hypothetical protein ACYATO_08785 [Lactobacillaceae bacterium Melli_B3]